LIVSRENIYSSTIIGLSHLVNIEIQQFSCP
jgi:hypothetical protein